MNIQEATQAISELFPNRYVKIVEYTSIGASCIQVEFANGDSSTAPNNYIMNHNAHMRFFCSAVDASIKGSEALNHPQDMERIVSHYKLRDAGLKYRKIKGKNAGDALAKLVKWFAANQAVILNVSEL